MIWGFVALDPLRSLVGERPPLESLTVERIELLPEGLRLHAVNGGPEPVTVAQVTVDEAYWPFTMEPSQTLPRLGRATVEIPYPWVVGEAHEIMLITSTGATFSAAVEVAVPTPRPDLGFWLLFALLGFYVGVVPVSLGLMWYPLLRRLGREEMSFLLALTVGLLVFLFVDTVLEGLEVAQGIPEVFQAAPLLVFAGMLSFLALLAVGRRMNPSHNGGGRSRLWLATTIALGIGLHNLGEGMAIGAAVALGEAALGSFLVIGFTLHNITEGIGIAAPIARARVRALQLMGLALLAGGPAILGTWLGGFSYSPLMAVLFLAVGAGAILQVVYEVSKLLLAERSEGSWVGLAGLTTGLVVMYVTALLVKF